MKVFDILIGNKQCWTISLDVTKCHDKGEFCIPTEVHKSIMTSPNGGGAAKSVCTTPPSHSSPPHASDYSMTQGRERRSNGVVKTNGKYLI